MKIGYTFFAVRSNNLVALEIPELFTTTAFQRETICDIIKTSFCVIWKQRYRSKVCSVQCAINICNTLRKTFFCHLVQFPIDILIKFSSQIFIILCFYHAVEKQVLELFFKNVVFYSKIFEIQSEFSSNFEDNFNTFFGYC